jgi:choline dehydrogenase-like flavoprotein
LPNVTQSADIVIVGSGIGGASLAYSLANSGRRIVVLERGEYLKDTPEARDDAAIFLKGVYRSAEQWVGTDGESFLPGNYYYVGGNSKFYGAVMYRYRVEDFAPRAHMDGQSPGWPIQYNELKAWYSRAPLAQTKMPSSILGFGFMALRACVSPTHRSCRPSSPAIRTPFAS